MLSDGEVVWLTEYRTFGVLKAEETYHGVVEFNLEGKTVTEIILRDEYEYWNEHAIDFESE